MSVRKIIRTALTSVVTAVVINAAVVGGYAFYSHTQTTHELNRRLHDNCQTGNDYRANDQAGWDKLFTIVGPGNTPEARKVIDDFRTFIHRKDAPRNCDSSVPTTTTIRSLP